MAKVNLIACTYYTTAGWDTLGDVGMDYGIYDHENHSNCESLIEFAGRNCYQSWDNPGKKTNAEYTRNILERGHGSVLEHSSATFFITGVSRSLTHELIRHRHLSFSELSQRFVDVGKAEIVCPPALTDTKLDFDAGVYYELVKWLEEKGLPRKQVREAARCCLPNAIETKIVVTGNFRAWRGVINARGSEHADAEIRSLVVEIARQLSDRFPAVFGDAEFFEVDGGYTGVRLKYGAV